MLSILLRITKISLALVIAFIATSCKMDIELPKKISGSGNMVSETRNLNQPFNKIHVSNVFDVYIEQAPTFEVVVKADDNLIAHVVTEVSGSTLKIKYDNSLRLSTSKNPKIYVKLPNIEELTASASSTIEVKGAVNTQDLILKTSSTADIKLAEVNAKSVIAEASSSSDIKINKLYTTEFKAYSTSTADIEVEYLEADVVDLTASSSSDIDLKGKALEMSVNTSSTATVDAKELWVNTVVVSSSSSSTVKVYPILSLKGTASSTADIYYYNEPKTIEKKTSSSGSVTKKNL